MSNALAIRPDTLPLTTVSELQTLGELLSKSGAFADARSAGQACVKILAGKELGFGAMASMTGVHFIEGKPTIGAHLMAALIKRSDKYDYKVVIRSREVCELEFLETDGKKKESLGSIRITYEEAEKSGWVMGKDGVKKNWRCTPDDMLFARAISKGFRTYCPDLSAGVVVYVPDEMELEGNERNGQAPEPKRIEAAAPEPEPVRAGAKPAAESVVEAPDAAEPVAEERPGALQKFIGVKAEEPRITAEQADEIRKLIRETGTDAKVVLAHYKATRGIPSLPAVAYQQIKDRLAAKKLDQDRAHKAAVEGSSLLISMEQADRIPVLCAKHKVGPVALQEFIGVKSWGGIPLRCWTFIRLLIESGADIFEVSKTYKCKSLIEVPAGEMAKMTRRVLMKKIDDLCEQLHIGMGDEWSRRLTELFGQSDASKLTVDQLETLESKLESVKASR